MSSNEYKSAPSAAKKWWIGIAVVVVLVALFHDHS